MNYFHLFTIGLVMILASCSTDIGIVDDNHDIPEETKTGEPLVVKRSSLLEINTALVDNDLDPLTEKVIATSRRSRDSKACLNAFFKGDINGDELISYEDVVEVLQLIKEYDNVEKYPTTANGDLRLEINTEYLGETPSFWDVVHVGQLVTYDEGKANKTYLDRYDAAVLADIITGTCD